MSPTIEEQIEGLKRTIAELEAQRIALGDEVVDAGLVPFQRKLEELVGKLQAREARPHIKLTQQRKLVTLLFMDIAGSTSIAQHMDPEDVSEVFDLTLKKLASPVRGHGGRVTRFMGDGFLSVFGAPTAREDDPERAIRAGLEIIETAQELTPQLEADWGIPDFQVRLGINTGLVMLGGETEAEDTLMGAAVNLAARLESAAPPGGLLVSHDTYRHIRGVFDVEPWEPIKVKGFDEAVQVYRVLRAKARAFRMGRRGVEGLETKTVGRDRELHALQEAYQTAAGRQETKVVTLVGDAGVGKSRLVYEFNNWLDLQPEMIWYFKGRASQQTQGIPQYLLRDMLADRFQILDSDPLTVVHEKFVTGVRNFLSDEGEMKAHILGTWLGYDFSDSPHLQPIRDEPEQIKNRATLYLAQLFAAIAKQSPVVILLDDIHWADSGSLHAITDLIMRQPELPLLVVCLTRPGLYERKPEWGERLPNYTRMDLASLSSDDTCTLVAEILRLVDPLPQVLLDLVSSRAEGNPFYAEELVKMLIDDGVILTGAEKWQVVPEQLLELKVPDTLMGVLQARLDKLQLQDRRAVQQAAVIGHIFWDKALEALDAEGPKTLPNLQTKEFIFPRSKSAFAGTAEYIFKHALLRDVTYETVLKRVRGRYHALVADWLVNTAEANGRGEEYAALIGEHYQLAGDDSHALSWFIQAAETASRVYANDEAYAHYTRAIEVAERISPDAVLLARLHHGRGLASDMLGEFDRARADFESTLQLSGSMGERGLEHLKWNALIDLGKLWASRDYHRAYVRFQDALELARQMDDPTLRAGSLNWMGNWYLNAEDPQTAITHHKKALAIFDQLGDRRGLAATLDLLGITNLLSGNLTAMVEYYDRAIELFRELGDLPSLASSLTGRGHAGCSGYYLLSCVSPAIPISPWRDFEEALCIAREIGSLAGEAWITWSLGTLQIVQGCYGQALEVIQSGLNIATQIGHREWITGNQSTLGYLYLELLMPEEAQRQLEAALTMAEELRSRVWIHSATGSLAAANCLLGDLTQAQTFMETVLSTETPMDTMGNRYCWARRAELALCQGDPELALDIVERLIASTPGMSPGGVVTFLWKLKAEALMALGQTEEAGTLLQTALDNAQVTGERFLLWRLHTSLGRLYSDLGQRSEAEKEYSTGRELVGELADTLPVGEMRNNFLERAYLMLSPFP